MLGVALQLVVAVALSTRGDAQRHEAVVETPAPEKLTTEPVDFPPVAEETCVAGRGRTRELLRDAHFVDAHLLAQTMSVLCGQDLASFSILDAIALTHLEEHQRAHEMFDAVARAPGPLAARAELLKAWALVEGNLGSPLGSTRLPLQDAARIQVFANIRRGASPGSAAKDLSDELRVAVTSGYAKVKASPRKRPWLAGSLSALLPGLGQAYAGSWQGAGVSLVLNGIFAAATVELIRNDLYFASATTGLAGSIFYVGNVLNAVDLARRYNEGSSREARENLGIILIPEAHF